MFNSVQRNDILAVISKLIAVGAIDDFEYEEENGSYGFECYEVSLEDDYFVIIAINDDGLVQAEGHYMPAGDLVGPVVVGDGSRKEIGKAVVAVLGQMIMRGIEERIQK